jgi:hypothetical protein
MSAPSGRIMRVIVIAKATSGIARPKSPAIRTTTNVTRKKSNASSVQPRKLATKVFRWLLESD